MSDKTVQWASVPSKDYRDWLSRADALFADPLWVEPIASALGTKVLYGFHAQRRQGIAVQIFGYSGLTVGYAGLPVSPGWLADPECRRQTIAPGVNMMRFNLSSLENRGFASAGERAQGFPETTIPDLNVWPQRNQRKLKKDRSFAARAGLVVSDLGPDSAGAVDSLYRATITRHHGSFRYHEGYFRAVIGLATRAERVSARGVLDEDGRLAGFAIFGFDGATAYYLHGGVADHARARGISDLLLDDAVQRAIVFGSKSLSLLPSPPSQSGLIAFKRKWGEADGSWATIDRPHGMLGGLAHLGMRVAGRLNLRLPPGGQASGSKQ